MRTTSSSSARALTRMIIRMRWRPMEMAVILPTLHVQLFANDTVHHKRFTPCPKLMQRQKGDIGAGAINRIMMEPVPSLFTSSKKILRSCSTRS
eukprot:3309991-Amphidinium_carterae.1